MENRLQRLSCKTQNVQNTKGATASEIAAPQPEDFYKENYWRQNCENLLTNHYRSLDAATPIRSIRCPAAKDNSITHAAAAPSNLDAAIPLRSASTGSRNAKNYAHRNNHSLQNTERRNQTTACATAAHTRYLSSPAAATSHGKTQGFVLRLPSAAIPMRSASTGSRNAQNYAHRKNHSLQNTEEEPNDRSRNRRTHTRYLSSPAAATLYGKTQDFVLRLPSHNAEHATFMQSFECDL